MTYGMFLPILPVFILLRPIAALVAGLFGGILVNFFDNDGITEVEECIHENKSLKDMSRYAFITLPEDIAKPLVVGILFASIIAISPPQDLLSNYITFGGFGELVTILVFSIPLYVCATASIPIAVVLVGKGTISIGGALIFLMAGPVTNMATISTIYKVLGKKIMTIYLFSVTSVALLFGYGINYYYPNLQGTIDWEELMHSGMHDHSEILAPICSIIIMTILLNAIFKPFVNKIKGTDLDTKINVSGMTCNHCKESVSNAISSINNVNDVKIDLDSGDVFISGDEIDIEEVYSSVKKIGFKIIK